MSALNKVRKWLLTFPDIQKIKGLNVDYYSTSPETSSIAPGGLQELSRKEDVLGNVIVESQYNFTLEFLMEKAIDDDTGATENADWLLSFQEWVQEQSIRHLVPKFGDDPKSETAKAENGVNEYADIEGNGIYTVQLSINFTKIYEVN